MEADVLQTLFHYLSSHARYALVYYLCTPKFGSFAKKLFFCSGYETDEQCEERLQELESGEIEVSFRNRVPLDCYTIEERDNAKTEI